MNWHKPEEKPTVFNRLCVLKIVNGLNKLDYIIGKYVNDHWAYKTNGVIPFQVVAWGYINEP